MKQIIEEVFEAEKKANEIIKKAREKASEIRQAAEKDNLEKIAEAKQKAKDIIRNAVENAQKEAEMIRQEEIKQAENEKESILGNETDLNNLVENICNIVINTEEERKY
ncbi:MAG: hypothetical protein JXA96_14235 [Sedimentisphaerales bacterium]|nr:hypothetical protein [Sedimentisphaerales bacterium]